MYHPMSKVSEYGEASDRKAVNPQSAVSSYPQKSPIQIKISSSLADTFPHINVLS